MGDLRDPSRPWDASDEGGIQAKEAEGTQGAGVTHRACFWCRASWQLSAPARSSSPGILASYLAFPQCPAAAGWPPGGSGRPCQPYPLPPQTASRTSTWLLLAAPACAARSGSAPAPAPGPAAPCSRRPLRRLRPAAGPGRSTSHRPPRLAGPASGQRAADYNSRWATRWLCLKSNGERHAACREAIVFRLEALRGAYFWST